MSWCDIRQGQPFIRRPIGSPRCATMLDPWGRRGGSAFLFCFSLFASRTCPLDLVSFCRQPRLRCPPMTIMSQEQPRLVMMSSSEGRVARSSVVTTSGSRKQRARRRPCTWAQEKGAGRERRGKWGLFIVPRGGARDTSGREGGRSTTKTIATRSSSHRMKGSNTATCRPALLLSSQCPPPRESS